MMNSKRLINIEIHKHLDHSSYNSKLGILGMVLVATMCFTAIMGIVFFNPAMLKQLTYKGKGIRRGMGKGFKAQKGMR